MVFKDSKKESNENNEPEADVDAEPSKTDFSGETKSYVPDSNNPNEFAYSSDKPDVFQPNRAQRGETEGQEEMPEFENPDLELPAVEGEMAQAPPPPPPGEQGKIQDLGEQFENTETPEVEQTIGDSYANQQGEITDSANILEDAEVPSEFGDRPIVGRAVGNQYDQQQEPSNAPEGVEYEEQTIPDEMVGGDKGGSYEMQTFKTQQPGNDELNETDPNEFHEQLDTGNADANVNPEAQVDNPVEQTVEQETTQIGVEGADVGADMTADVAAETGLEAAGAALDATGVGSIIGLVLGFVGAGIGVAQAVEGTNENNKEASDEEQETSLDSAKNTIQANLAKQQFVGANVMAALSSTTAQNVTSAAF